ncbi:hypothetical protein [Sphingomonas sp.]|uniref:hypothetical protein n=1 Tax=Sphingomonas sp. TaxID=28214 RepID=UPI003CC5E360
MRISPAALLADAWAAFRRDGTLLVPVAGVFWFLPLFALALLVPQPPALPDAEPGSQAATTYADQAINWVLLQGGWIVLAQAVMTWGSAVFYLLYLDPARPDVRGAVERGVRLWPRFLLLGLVVGPLEPLGLRLFVLPAVWLLARFMLAAPALAAEAPLGVWRALGRSWRLSRGVGLPLMALVALTLAPGVIAPQLLLQLDGILRGQPGGENVAAVVIVDALIALTATAAALGAALIAVSAYRALARKGI